MVIFKLKTFVVKGKGKNKLRTKKKDVEDLPLSFNFFLIKKWEDFVVDYSCIETWSPTMGFLMNKKSDKKKKKKLSSLWYIVLICLILFFRFHG